MKIEIILCLAFLSVCLPSHAQDNTSDPRLAKLNAYCNVPGSPFVYEKETHRYFITINESENGKQVPMQYLIRFCPFTGTQLPDGKDAFYDIDTEFQHRILSKVVSARTLAGVKTILGKPDEEYGPTDDYKGELLYTSLSKTTMIIIQQDNKTNAIHVMAAGKLKPTPGKGGRL